MREARAVIGRSGAGTLERDDDSRKGHPALSAVALSRSGTVFTSISPRARASESARGSAARRRPFAVASRCNYEPVQLQLWVRIFACNRARGARCRAGPWAFCKLRDDGIVPLICPTCQNVFAGIAQSIHASDHHATLHGVVSDILVGSQSRVGPCGCLPGPGEASLSCLSMISGPNASRFVPRKPVPTLEVEPEGHASGSCSRSEGLLRQIRVEERRQLAEVLLRLGRIGIARILRMRLALEHVEIRDDNAGLTQLAMHAHRIGQEQVTRARCENGRRKTGQVAIDRRKLRILQVMAVGIELRGIAEASRRCSPGCCRPSRW